MKLRLLVIACCLASTSAVIGPLPASLAAGSKQPAAAPTVYVKTPPGAQSPKNFHVTEEGLKRQIKQLERAEHMLELSAGTDRTSHSAIAAQHIRTAINELKLEEKQTAKSKNTVQHNESAVEAAPATTR